MTLLQQSAEALRLGGDLDRSREACDEATAAAQGSRTLIWECDAWLSLARVLLAQGIAETSVAEGVARALKRAQELIDQTGSERHLREAHRLYVEMGAAAHAARTERALGEF